MDDEPDPGLERRTPFPGAASGAWSSTPPPQSASARPARSSGSGRRGPAGKPSAPRTRTRSRRFLYAQGLPRLQPPRRAGKGACPYCGASVRWAPGPGSRARSAWRPARLRRDGPGGAGRPALRDHDDRQLAVHRADFLTALFAPDLRALYNMGGLDAGSVLEGQVWRLWTTSSSTLRPRTSSSISMRCFPGADERGRLRIVEDHGPLLVTGLVAGLVSLS